MVVQNMYTEDQKELVRKYFNDDGYVVLHSLGFEYTFVLSKERLEASLVQGYGIKVNKLLRYDNIKRFISDQINHGPYLVLKGTSILHHPINITDDYVTLMTFDDFEKVTFEDLAKQYVWQNGYPVGDLGETVLAL